jgi:hypothetical protein
MSLYPVSGAVRNLDSERPFLHIAYESTPAFLKRVIDVVSSQLEGISLSYGPWGSTSPTSLLNRAVFVSAIALSLLTFFLRYRALPPNSVERRQCCISFFKHSVLLLAAGMAGLHFITAFFALNWFIQLKNAYFVHPRLSHPDVPTSRIERSFQIFYTPIKYLFLSAIAKCVFEACKKNFLNGVLFYGLASIIVHETEPGKIGRKSQEKTLAQVESAVEKSLGSYVSSSLFEVAITSGVGAAMIFRSCPMLISGMGLKNLYDFLYGLRVISFGFIIYLFDSEPFEYFNDLDLYSFEFVRRFSSAVNTAHEASRTSEIRLSDSHFDRTSRLTLGYIVKKNQPSNRQWIIKELEKLHGKERLIYFLESQLILDVQEQEEFLTACKIRITELCSLLSPEHIQRIFLSPHVASRLNQEGLETIAKELEILDNEIDAVASKYSDQENRDILIYREIQEKNEKLREYSLSIGTIVYLLETVEQDSVKNLKTREYIQNLKELLPSIKIVNQKLSDLESKVEKHTAEQSQPTEVALGNKGLRESHCAEILKALHLPSIETTYGDLSRMLLVRGVKTKYDLVQKELLVPTDSIDQLKDRIIRFLSSPAAVSPWGDRAMRVAHQIYAFVAVPFFIALQLYAQPWLSTAGLLCGIVASLFFSSRLNTHFFRREEVLLVSTGILTTRELTAALRFRLIFFDLFAQAQLLLGCLSRFGFIPAFIWGTQLPLRLLTYRDTIRQRLQPA